MTHFKVTFLAGLLACSIALTGCAGNAGSSALAGQKVATVDGIVVTRGDYDKVYAQFKQMLQMGNGTTAVDPMMEETLKRLTLNRLFLRTFLHHDAEKWGVSVTPDDVQKIKDDQIKQVGGKEALDNLLKQHAMTEADFEDSIKEQILMNKLLEKMGGDSLKVSDPEVEKYYSSHPTEFDIPETIHASHILIKAIVPEMKRSLRERDPKMTDEAINQQVEKEKAALKQKAETIFNQVKTIPTEFATLAQKDSDDKVSAARGGDLDNLQQSQVDPVFWAAIDKTKPGTLYPSVLETQFGYHIIRVIDHVGAHRQTLKEARNNIVNRLSDARKKELFEKWTLEKKKSQIVIEPAFKPMDSVNKQAPAKADAAKPAPGKS